MSNESQLSEATNTLMCDQATTPGDIAHFSHMTEDCHMSDSSDMPRDDDLEYDWEICETLKIVKAFSISDYGTKSDATSSDSLVPEPLSLSRIIDTTSRSSSSSKTSTDIEEKYVEDDMSSLSIISDIKVSNTPRHTFGKEKVEKHGNIYNKLFNACLKGQLSVIKEILETCNTSLQDEHGQTPVYAACIGNHPEVIKILIDSGYDVNHQDNEGKTPLHITFENHVPDLANTLITQFRADTEIRDALNWTPLHTAIDKGYNNYSQQLSQKFLWQDAGTDRSWIQLHAGCFQENTQIVQFLLSTNTDVNHVSSVGNTALHIAVSKSNICLVSYLLDQNADVNIMSACHALVDATLVRGQEFAKVLRVSTKIRQQTPSI